MRSDVNDQNLLTWIPFLIRMLAHIQEITTLNMHHDPFKTEPSLNCKLCVLLGAPLIVVHDLKVLQRVPYGNTYFLRRAWAFTRGAVLDLLLRLLHAQDQFLPFDFAVELSIRLENLNRL